MAVQTSTDCVPSEAKANLAQTAFEVINGALSCDNMDWDVVRDTEGHDLIRLDATSIAAGGVFQRDIVSNLRLLLHMLVKFELEQPTGPILKEAFLMLNRERGILVAGAIKQVNYLGKPLKSSKVLKREISDWAAQQAGRLRALLVLVIRMTRRTLIAKTEEIQVLKDLIAEMEGFKPMAASASEALLDETTEQEAVLVPQSSMTYSDDDAGEADPGSQAAVHVASTDTLDVDEDSQVVVAKAAAHPEEGRKPLIEADVVPGSCLRDQLMELGDDNPDLDILEEQRRIKKQARDEKAAKQLAKGAGKGKAKAKPKAKGKAKGKAKAKAKADFAGEEAHEPSEGEDTPATGATPNEKFGLVTAEGVQDLFNLKPNADKGEEGKADNGEEGKADKAEEGKADKGEGAANEAGGAADRPDQDEEAPPPKKCKKDLRPLVPLGLTLPTGDALKKKSFTVRDPGLVGSSIAININTQGFYVSSTWLDAWVLELAKMHNIPVNKQGGSSVSWKKHGVNYGWRLCLLLGGWVSISSLPQPIPEPADPENEAAVRMLVARVQTSKGF